MYCLKFLLLARVAMALPFNRLSLRGGAVHTGEMTFNADFSSNACNLPPGGMSVAISAATFDPHSPTTNGIKNPNRNDLCGKMLQISESKTGASTTATIVDRKASGVNDAIDVISAVFTALGVNSATGHVQISWTEPGYP